MIEIADSTVRDIIHYAVQCEDKFHSTGRSLRVKFDAVRIIAKEEGKRQPILAFMYDDVMVASAPLAGCDIEPETVIHIGDISGSIPTGIEVAK